MKKRELIELGEMRLRVSGADPDNHRGSLMEKVVIQMHENEPHELVGEWYYADGFHRPGKTHRLGFAAMAIGDEAFEYGYEVVGNPEDAMKKAWRRK
jgi:hypothetical protein